jgi:hypothetical protein
MNNENAVSVLTLNTGDTALPDFLDGASMTPERLAESRRFLATVADSPIATLEAHPVPADLDRSAGMRLESTSPLAGLLSQVGVLAKVGGSRAVASGAAGEALYRMVVPAKFAAQVGGGLLTPMVSTTVKGGVNSALVGSSRIVGQAAFVPVAGTAAGVGGLAVAAPLVMMAAAVGVGLYAERQRQQALDKIVTLLEQLQSDALNQERDALNGCRGAVNKATAILLDQGRAGLSLGLDSATSIIETAMAATERRLKDWQRGLAKLDDKKVEIANLRKVFDGFDQEGGEFGEFGAHLGLAELAIALKKRVIVLQAVEHAQEDPKNGFRAFVRALRDDQEHVIKIESQIADVKRRLGTLQLDRSHGLADFMFTPGEVDHLLRTAYLLRDLGQGVISDVEPSDVAIDMARNSDGSVVVFPALTLVT